MPCLVVDNYTAAVVKFGQVLHLLHSLLSHLLVKVLASLVVQIDASGLFECSLKVLFHEQFHSLLAVLHTSRGIDARPYLKDDVIHRQLAVSQSAHLDNGLQANAGVRVQTPQPMISQHTVFAHHRHNVRRNAHGAKVEQGRKFVKLYAIAGSKRLHEFEAHATPRKVRVGIVVVGALGVEYGHRARQLGVGHMVVANDKVDAQALGISYLVNSLDATVEHHNQPHPRLGGKVDAFL